MEKIYFVKANLSDSEKLKVIRALFECYFNTDLDCEEFGKEFYYTTDLIMDSKVPVSLNHLIDFRKSIILAVPSLKGIIPDNIDILDMEKYISYTM